MNPQQYPPPYPQQPGQPGQSFPPQPQSQPPQYGAPQPGAQPGQYPPQPPAGGPYPPQPPVPPSSPTPGYNPYAYPGEYKEPPRKKGGKGKLLIGVIATLLIIGVIAAALAASSGNQTGNNQTTQQQTSEQTTSNAGADVVPRSDGILDLSKRIKSSETLKAQIIKAKVREQINLSSGFSFMVNQVEDYVSPNPATKAAAGKKFVVATVVVGNRNQTGNISVSYLDFRLRDDANQLTPGHITTNEILSNQLASPSELKPGAQINGKIVFEVDAADTQWVLKHSETYQKTTDNTTFSVEGEIVVDLSKPAAEETTTEGTGTTPPPATPPASQPVTQ